MNRRGACTLALALACVTAGGVTCAKPAAEAGPGFIPLVTNKDKLFAIPPMGKPAYRVPVRDPVFGTTLTRIANDPGASTSPVHGKWGPDARHVYSKQQPWNATGTLMTIENRGAGASPSPLLLDGETYAPHAAPCPDYPAWDYRWHPSREHANEQINVDAAGTELMWFDVTTCTKTRSWPLPFAAHYGIGSGEGGGARVLTRVRRRRADLMRRVHRPTASAVDRCLVRVGLGD